MRRWGACKGCARVCVCAPPPPRQPPPTLLPAFASLLAPPPAPRAQDNHVTLPPERFDATDAELFRFAKACGLLAVRRACGCARGGWEGVGAVVARAPTPHAHLSLPPSPHGQAHTQPQRVAALEAAVRRVVLALEWRSKQRLLPDKQLRRWERLVGWRGRDAGAGGEREGRGEGRTAAAEWRWVVLAAAAAAHAKQLGMVAAAASGPPTAQRRHPPPPSPSARRRAPCAPGAAGTGYAASAPRALPRVC